MLHYILLWIHAFVKCCFMLWQVRYTLVISYQQHLVSASLMYRLIVSQTTAEVSNVFDRQLCFNVCASTITKICTPLCVNCVALPAKLRTILRSIAAVRLDYCNMLLHSAPSTATASFYAVPSKLWRALLLNRTYVLPHERRKLEQNWLFIKPQRRWKAWYAFDAWNNWQSAAFQPLH